VCWAVCDVDQLRSLAWLSLGGILSVFTARFPRQPVPGVSGGQHAGAGMEAAATSVGSEGSPQLSSLAEMAGGVHGFCSSRSWKMTWGDAVLAVSERMLGLVSCRLHLGCSPPHTSLQLGTAALCAIDFQGSRVANGGMQFLVGRERWLLCCC